MKLANILVSHETLVGGEPLGVGRYDFVVKLNAVSCENNEYVQKRVNVVNILIE